MKIKNRCGAFYIIKFGFLNFFSILWNNTSIIKIEK
nr:MAG TPA: hypothetical protein [Bacteriophage sp.]